MTGPTGLTIASRFNGPPTTANGGMTAGLVAAAFPDGSAVRVTLRQAPPLDVMLTLDGDPGTGLRLLDADRVVAEAAVVDPAELGEAVADVDPAVAAEAMSRFDGLVDHPFPTCFVCGPQRGPDDGLGLFAGAVDPREPGRTATLFRARADLTQHSIGTGVGDIIGAEMLWAALDCPGGWTLGLPGRPAVLGRMTAQITAVPEVGERCVVVGQLDRRDGRKGYTRTTAYGADGRELGRSAAVWIEIAPPT